MQVICNDLCKVFIRLLSWIAGFFGLRLIPAGAPVLPVGWMMFDPALAKEIGVNEAIIFQGIDGWVQHNRLRGKNIKEGRAWSYNTIPNWGKVFCWLNADYVGKLIRKLEKDGRLLSAKFAARPSDQTKYYSTTAGIIPDSDAQQLSLWPGENIRMRERKAPHDSSITKPNNQSSRTKNQNTNTRAGATKGGVGVFKGHIPGSEMPEKKIDIPEGRPEADEHEPVTTIQGTSATADSKTIPPVPRAPLPPQDVPTDADSATETETASSGDTKPVDVPEWMPKFFDGSSDSELAHILHRFTEPVLLVARDYALNSDNHVKNPPGFVRVQLAKGWRPPPEKIRFDNTDSMSYITGAFADFIEH